MINDPRTLAEALAVALIALGAAGLPARALFARLACANLFIALFWVSLPFSVPGEAFFSGTFSVSREGIFLALVISLKCNAVLVALTALLGTSTVFTLTHALHRLGLSEKLTQIFFFSFRYFQLIHAEYLRLREAMQVRAFRPRMSLHCYTSYARLFGMLLVRSLDRAERVREAMLCRGYDGCFRVVARLSPTLDDLFFTLAFIPVCIFLFFRR